MRSIMYLFSKQKHDKNKTRTRLVLLKKAQALGPGPGPGPWALALALGPWILTYRSDRAMALGMKISQTVMGPLNCG